MTGSPARLLVPGLLALAAVAAACDGGSGGGDTPPAGETPGAGQTPASGAISISSVAFADGDAIPERFTCDGDNVSPALSWGGYEGVQTFALIVDDPDAPGGTFSHWLIFNIAPTRQPLSMAGPVGGSLSEAVQPLGELPLGTRQGTNDAGSLGYTGPCPPSGPAHNYRFTVYALDVTLELAAGATRQQLLDAMEGHILGKATLTGTYGL